MFKTHFTTILQLKKGFDDKSMFMVIQPNLILKPTQYFHSFFHLS